VTAIMHRRIDLVHALACLLALAGLLALAPAASAADPAPTLSLDTTFAPPTGIAKFDFTSGSSATDQPYGAAIDGTRTYTIGETRDASGDSQIGIIARRNDGTFDPGFAGDGQLTLGNAPLAGRDVGASMIVLPDHRLRIVGALDVDNGSGTNLDVEVIGLNADGTPDRTFGGGDGVVTFPVGPGNDNPTRIISDAQGRLAIAGSFTTTIAGTTNTTDDTFVALLDPSGNLVPGFGTGGIRTFNRSGGQMDDRAVDIATRPGGGFVALLRVETDPGTPTAYISVLHAIRDDGSDDPAFGTGGERILTVGTPDTIPGALINYGGMLWATGSTKNGADTDAWLARTDGNGNGAQYRTFDMRGNVVAPTQAVNSQGLDLTVVPGVPDTLAVGGYVSTTDGIEWGISAFNDITGDLAKAGYGDIVIPVSGQGQVVGVTAGPGWVGVAGSTLGLSSTGSSTLDSSYNNAKLLIDADKACDLALTVPRPLELTMKGDAAGTVNLKVANAGTKSCGGTITAPKHYVLSAGGKKAPLTVAPLAAGASRTIKNATLRYTGTRRADDTVAFKLAAPADKTTTNNVATLHVVYAYCDLGLRASKAGSAPNEGTRRYRFVLRNRGTDTCRGVGVGVAKGGSRTSGERPFSLDAGRSATTSILASLRRGGKIGARRAITFTVRAKSQVNAANDHVTLHPRLVRVGDSRVRRAGARGVSGSATRGRGKLSRRALAVRSVQVAIHRLGGKRCTWIASTAGRTRAFKASRHGCTHKVWMTAAGGRSWHLSLQRSLPRGRYEAFSRAVIGAGFAEGRFGRADGNLVRFRVG
jgi:hypothetical protein